MAKSEEKLKSLFMRVKKKSENVGLKLNIQKNKFIGASLNHFMENRWRNSGSSDRFYFLGSKITANGDYSHEIKRCFLLGRKVLTNLDSVLNSRDITLLIKCSQSNGFSSSLVRMCVLDHKEGWSPKKWCFHIVVLEKTLESPLDCRDPWSQS